MPLPFKNVGNSCYLGTALHALLHCPQLTNYFLKNLEGPDTNRRKKNAAAFVDAYRGLVDAYWTSGKDLDCAFEQVRTLFLKQHGKTFKEGQQHDAHEALMCLLQMLHAGLSKTKKIEGSKAARALEGTTDRLRAWDDNSGSNNYSILSEIFQLQSENHIQTPDGKYQSTTYEHMFDLGVPVCKDVRDGMKSGLETISDYVLENGTKTSITRTQHITYMPLILIIHIKRFTNQNDKINDYVDYPIHLDRHDRHDKHDRNDRHDRHDKHGGYDLFGVILHHGTMDTGHYTCVVKHGDNTWFMCNDERIEEIKNINHVMSPNAYVLLYKKINP